MRKILSLVLAVVMLTSLASFGLAETTAEGYGNSQQGGENSLGVKVTFDGETITAIEVIANNDTAGISDPAVAQIPAAIVEAQSTLVDAVAGATYTSDAIKLAVEDAIAKAGLDVANFKKEVEKKEVEKAANEEMVADVVVIGAGGAGMAAAVQAHQNGAKVIVIEKMGKMGGNTILAGGALNAVDDRSETAIKQNDSVQWHYTQTLNGGDNKGDPALVHTMVSNAWAGVQWLKDMGMEFKPELFTVLGGMWPRAHKPVEPVGTGFFKTYQNYVDTHEGIYMKYNTKAEELLQDETGRVVGVRCTGETGNTITVKAEKGLVVATGGFAKNVELRQAYNIQWANLDESIRSTNHPGATGDA